MSLLPAAVSKKRDAVLLLDMDKVSTARSFAALLDGGESSNPAYTRQIDTEVFGFLDNIRQLEAKVNAAEEDVRVVLRKRTKSSIDSLVSRKRRCIYERALGDAQALLSGIVEDLDDVDGNRSEEKAGFDSIRDRLQSFNNEGEDVMNELLTHQQVVTLVTEQLAEDLRLAHLERDKAVHAVAVAQQVYDSRMPQ